MKRRTGTASWMNDKAKLAAAIEKRRVTYAATRARRKVPKLEMVGAKPSASHQKRKYVRHNKTVPHSELVLVGKKVGHKLMASQGNNGYHQLLGKVPAFLDIIWDGFTPLEKAKAIEFVRLG